MEDKKPSFGESVRNQTARLYQKSRQAGSYAATCFLNWTSDKARPWCRDHLVSIALLMAFPVAIGAFYWGKLTSDIPSQTQYSQTVPVEVPASQFDEKPNPNSAVVAPTAPDAFETPRVLTFAGEREDSGFSRPQPLPISVDYPHLADSLENYPIPASNASVPANYQTISPSAKCVWLTGTIEDFDAPPGLIQNVSPVREFPQSQ